MIMRSSQRALEGGPSAQSALGREQGYVLLFALGLMAVVTTLILSVTVTLRLDAQLLTRDKAVLQEEYLLRGAAQLTAIQLGITYAVTTLRPPLSKESLNTWRLWHPQGEAYEAAIGSANVLVELKDISGLPDANLLTLPEWERIFLLLGANTPEVAKILSTKIVDLRDQLVRIRNTAGFANLEEILEWREFATFMTQRSKDKTLLELEDLIAVGTRSKQVDLRLTPLPLLQALGNVTNEHLLRLATLRRSNVINSVQAQQWLQGTGLTALAMDAPPIAVRARLRMVSPNPRGLTLVAVLAGENGEYSVIDQRMEKSEARY